MITLLTVALLMMLALILQTIGAGFLLVGVAGMVCAWLRPPERALRLKSGRASQARAVRR